MKYLFIIIIVIGGVYQLTLPETKLDILMKESSAEYEGGFIEVNINPYKEFDIHDVAEIGNITVVEFYTKICSGCITLDGYLKRFLTLRDDVIVKQILMPDNWNEEWAMNKYGLDIRATPHIYIFDDKGNMLEEDVGLHKPAYKLLGEWLITALRNDDKKRKRGQT